MPTSEEELGHCQFPFRPLRPFDLFPRQQPSPWTSLNPFKAEPIEPYFDFCVVLWYNGETWCDAKINKELISVVHVCLLWEVSTEVYLQFYAIVGTLYTVHYSNWSISVYFGPCFAKGKNDASVVLTGCHKLDWGPLSNLSSGAIWGNTDLSLAPFPHNHRSSTFCIKPQNCIKDFPPLEVSKYKNH